MNCLHLAGKLTFSADLRRVSLVKSLLADAQRSMVCNKTLCIDPTSEGRAGILTGLLNASLIEWTLAVSDALRLLGCRINQ